VNDLLARAQAANRALADAEADVSRLESIGVRNARTQRALDDANARVARLLVERNLAADAYLAYEAREFAEWIAARSSRHEDAGDAHHAKHDRGYDEAADLDEITF
jgi:hypothetical protein